MLARLTAVKGLMLGQSFPITGELTFGRDAGNGISIADSQVSRRHCRVFMADSGPIVEDLGSSNGTFVNDRRISGAMPLYPGDRLRVAENEFVFEVQDPVTARPKETSRFHEGPSVSQPGLPSVQPINNAWTLPDLSFLTQGIDGCIAGLFRFLPYIAAFLACICILGKLASLGLGILSCAAMRGGQSNPPANSSPTNGGQNPAPSAQEDADSGIEILSAKVVVVHRPAFPTDLNALVLKWRNKTGHPVGNMIADVQCYDEKGGYSITKPLVVVYSGVPVPDGVVHADTEDTATLLTPVAPSGTRPASAKLENITVK